MTERAERPPIRIPPKPCVGCKHYDQPEWNCRAFPWGIPEPIRRGEHMHREPFPGDGGLQFEPIEDVEEIPEPPSGVDPTMEQVEAWLRDLEQHSRRSGLGAGVRARIQEHVETAHHWLDWMRSRR